MLTAKGDVSRPYNLTIGRDLTSKHTVRYTADAVPGGVSVVVYKVTVGVLSRNSNVAKAHIYG